MKETQTNDEGIINSKPNTLTYEPIKNDKWCSAECPYFEKYGDEYDLTARCKLLKIEELIFYDWFIAEC